MKGCILFKNVNYEDFKNGVKRIVQKNTYMPSVAELKKEIATFTTKELQAFLSYKIKVIDFIRLRKYAEMDTSGTTKDMDALIKNFLPSMYFEYVLGE